MYTQNNSLLPVEVTNEIFDVEDIFNSQQHRSHLLNCKRRQRDWENVKKTYLKFPQKIME